MRLRGRVKDIHDSLETGLGEEYISGIGRQGWERACGQTGLGYI
jgi:hypothetical protein